MQKDFKIGISNPQISIIIPCYNQEQFLEDCLNSVLLQSFQNWEAIIINDGSTDLSEKIATQFVQKDSRIRYFFKKNEGVCKARNFGIEKAEGKYILPLDADDSINNHYLSFAAKHFNFNYKVITCKARYFGERKGIMDLGVYDFNKFLIRNQIHNSSIFLKNDFQKMGGYDENLKNGIEDWEFFIRLLKDLPESVLSLDYIGLNYRIKANSRSKKLADMHQLKNESFQYIYYKHHQLYSDKFPNLINILQENFYLKKDNEFYRKKLNKIYKNKIYILISRFKNLLNV